MNICESLTNTAKVFPTNVAIFFEGHSISYAQLNTASAAAAQLLQQHCVQPGDRVAIMLPNVPAFAVWYFAALRIGAIAVSVSSRLAESEIQFVIDDCDPKVFVDGGQNPAVFEQTTSPVHLQSCDFGRSANGTDLPSVDAASENTFHSADPHDAALILYTSGTTGFPKGATLSHANVRSNVAAFNHLCNQQPHDRILLSVPLFHCFGQNALLNSALNVGATLIMQRQFDLTEAHRLIVEQNVTQLYGVPMMFQLLHDRCQPTDLGNVTYCFSAATTLPLQTAEQWREKFGMPIYEGYGLTETSPFASYNHRIRFTPGSIGTPIDSVEMKIVDPETGQDCGVDQPGEIVIKGPNVMLGYWNRDQDTHKAIKDGWFHSGDIGQVDQDGFFFIVDRVKDMISVGGLKVYPAEVERVLLDHPQVDQAAVVGFPDDVFGEQVVAFVVGESIQSEATEEVRTFAQSRLANYKSPRQVIVIEDLPRNPSGKILKTKLREFPIASASNDSDAPNQLRPATLKTKLDSAHLNNRTAVATEFLQGLVETIGDLEEPIDPESRFLDVGLDSLMIVEMSAQLQTELGERRPFSATTIFDYPRVCDLAGYLVEQFFPASTPQDLPEKVTAPPANVNLRKQVEDLSEDEALQELMKELD